MTKRLNLAAIRAEVDACSSCYDSVGEYVPALLDRLEAAENAVDKLLRFVFPLIMEVEQAEMIAGDEGKPLDEATVLLSFMGSGASDRSTLFDYHEARRANDALTALRKGGDAP